MKWFKHFSDASNDETLEQVISEFGLDGYARWWLLLEAVARNMDSTDKCSAEYSWTKWQQILRGKRNKLETFLERFGNKLEMNQKQNGNILEIKVPKLLELRDNYTKNLQVTIHPPCKQEVEEEEDTDIYVKDSPPSIEEVKAYCVERNNSIDPEYFVMVNNEKGWVTGKKESPVKNWKLLIVTWEKNEKRYSKQTPQKPAYNPQRDGYV